jgi:hypothetical protein
VSGGWFGVFGGVCAAIAVGGFACWCLYVMRRRNGHMHVQTMLDAATTMAGSLDTVPPQRDLLRKVVETLAAQDHAAKLLEQRVHGLLPEPSFPEADSTARGQLDLLAGQVTKLWRHSAALAGLNQGLVRVLEQVPPHKLASAFTAKNFDLSAFALAPAQLVFFHESADANANPPVLNEVLGQYEAEILADAIKAFIERAPELADVPAGRDASHQWTVTKDVIDVVLEGIPVLSCASRETPPRGGEVRHELTGNQPGSPVPEIAYALELSDVFDINACRAWRADISAYFPFFTFVVTGLGELRLLDRAQANLAARARELRDDSACPPESLVAHAAARTELLPGIGAAPSAVASALTGGKVTGIVLARRLTWRMSDHNAAIQTTLCCADAAACRLAALIGDVLASERGAFFAEIGGIPRLDTIDRAEIARVARDLHDTTEQHVRLTCMLVRQARAISQRDVGSGLAADIAALSAAVAAAERLVRASRASLAEGACLRALSQLTEVRLPLAPVGFPGRKFHEDALAQVRPLAVLALAHQMVVARWMAKAVSSYFRRRCSLAAVIASEVVKYGRAHDGMVGAINAAVLATDRRDYMRAERTRGHS